MTEVQDHPVDGLTRTSGAPRRSTDLNRRTSLDGPKAAGWNDGYQSSTYFQSRGTQPYYDAKNSSHEDLTVLATSKDAPARGPAVVRPASDTLKPRRSESADLPPGATGFVVAPSSASGGARRVPGLQDVEDPPASDGPAGAQYYNNARRSRDYSEPADGKPINRQSSLLDLQEHE